MAVASISTHLVCLPHILICWLGAGRRDEVEEREEYGPGHGVTRMRPRKGAVHPNMFEAPGHVAEQPDLEYGKGQCDKR
jgi:hypothetical protein